MYLTSHWLSVELDSILVGLGAKKCSHVFSTSLSFLFLVMKVETEAATLLTQAMGISINIPDVI